MLFVQLCEGVNASHSAPLLGCMPLVGDHSSLVGVSWAFLKEVKDLLLSWEGSFVGKKRRKICNSIPLYIFWTVWKERNRITFMDGTLAI